MLDYLPRAGAAIGGLAGWVQSGRIKTKVDVQHGLEDSHILEPASLAIADSNAEVFNYAPALGIAYRRVRAIRCAAARAARAQLRSSSGSSNSRSGTRQNDRSMSLPFFA